MLLVTNCGHDSHHPAPCDIEHPCGLSDYLLLLVKTDAWFYLEQKHRFTDPNMAALFDKNTYIHYGRNTPNYNDDWIHFDLTETEAGFLRTLGIPLNTPFYPLDFWRLSRYVQIMSAEFRTPSPHTPAILDSLMRALLYSLAAELPGPTSRLQDHKHYARFSRVRTRLYNNPAADWSVHEVSASLDLSVSYFQHLYKDFFSCSFQQDVIRARLEQAKFYLSNSNMSIRNLANFCGYDNELHFMRQFKKIEGETPSEYRSSH